MRSRVEWLNDLNLRHHSDHKFHTCQAPSSAFCLSVGSIALITRLIANAGPPRTTSSANISTAHGSHLAALPRAVAKSEIELTMWSDVSLSKRRMRLITATAWRASSRVGRPPLRTLPGRLSHACRRSRGSSCVYWRIAYMRIIVEAMINYGVLETTAIAVRRHKWCQHQEGKAWSAPRPERTQQIALHNHLIR